MKSAGLCNICGDAAKTGFTCPICGKNVCNKCITVGGSCKACLGGRKVDDIPEDMLDKLI